MESQLIFTDLPGLDPDFDSTVTNHYRSQQGYGGGGHHQRALKSAPGAYEMATNFRRRSYSQHSSCPSNMHIQGNGSHHYASIQYQNGYAEPPWYPPVPEASIIPEQCLPWTETSVISGLASPTPSFTDGSASDDGSHGASSQWSVGSVPESRFHGGGNLPPVHPMHQLPSSQQAHSNAMGCSTYGSAGPLVYPSGCSGSGIKMEDVYPDDQPDDLDEQEGDVTRIVPFDMKVAPCSEPEDHALTPASQPTSGAENIKEESMGEEEDDASDYSPRSPRKTKTPRAKRWRRHAPSSNKGMTKASKRTASGRITKQANSSQGEGASLHSNRVACPHCSQSVHSKASLNKHIATAHTRPFTCTLQQYGCISTFGSKNEWKRHVSSQHLRLGFWRCQLGRCYPQPDPENNDEEEELIFNDFNRKDLFMQHLRRMHAPHPSSLATDKAAFNATLERETQRCFIAVRTTPSHSVCGFCAYEGKEQVFEGPGAWESRMEHVGRHLESGHGEERSWVEDRALRQWLIDEGLIEGDDSKGWRLVGLQSDEKGRRK